MPLPIDHLCQFASKLVVHFLNIIFKSLLTEEQTDRQTDGQSDGSEHNTSTCQYDLIEA